MKELIFGIIIGMVLIYLVSKFFCFKNQKEWNKFKNRWLQSQRKL